MLDTWLIQRLVSRVALFIVIGVASGTFLSGCGDETVETVQALPPIRISPGILNWGEVLPGSTSDGSVSLTNVGTQPVKIITVQPGCKCTTTTGLDGVIIAPGESRDLVASLDAQPSPGTRNVQIKILFDGYSKPLEINGTAVITHPVRVRPPYINAVDEANVTGTLMVNAGDQVPFKVLSVDGKAPRFVRKDMDQESRVSHIISYDINDHIEEDGRFRRWVVVETDHPTAPLVEVLLRHRNSSLDVNPAFKQGAYHFNMGRVQPGNSVQLKHLTHNATSTGPIGMIVAEQEGINIEILSQEIDDESDDLSVELRVDISPDMAEGFYYFPIKIYAANQVEMVLPGFVSVRPEPVSIRGSETSAAKSIQK